MAQLQSSLSISSDLSTSSEYDSSEKKTDFSSPEEELLYYARNGCASDIQILFESAANKHVSIDINCKGEKKSNRGWTPLHLAAYFGHSAVVRILLEAGAAVNPINSAGDTPLHRAAYTGREDVVGLLLEFGAEITMVNSEGHRPRDVTRCEHIINMLDAAASHEARLLHSQLLNGAATGDMDLLHSVMASKTAPNISIRDEFGNTALHQAAMHGHAEVAVFLLQNGIDPDLRNVKGQTALQVAQSPQMKQVLGVQPIKTLKLHPQRFEGPMAKKSRFVGFKNLWVVLERGVLSYFQTRGDASTGTKRKGMKYLDEARLWVSQSNPQEIKVFFSDGVAHTLSLELSRDLHVNRQKWMNALNEHIAFSTHYTHQGEQLKDDEELMPLGTMQDSLQTAQAHQKILEKQCHMLKNTVDTLEHFILRSPAAVAAQSNHNAATVAIYNQEHEYLRSIQVQASELLKSSSDMCSSLSHCMMLFNQQEQVRQVQLQEQTEKCRVLQDSLHALAAEHHELERSLGRSQSIKRDDDEFFDCDDDSYGSYLPEKFADALSQDLIFEDVGQSDSPVAAQDGHVVRTQLPVPMFSRADFSVWSILKQCIGKELSKITMPVIFNEPLSFLQRITEYMEYGNLLRTASQTEDPVLRMQYVAAFAVSAVSSNWERIGKPFNPLLGETYELDRKDVGFRMMSEQVSHHPPISAFHVEGEGYSLNGSVLPKLRFWGKSVEITPKGTITLSLPKHSEVYTWQNVNCCIHNVIVGKLWVEHTGTMEIVNHKTKMKAVVNFKQCGWFGKDLHKVEGFIYGPRKQKLKALYGSWVLGLYAADVEEYESALKPSSRGPTPSNSFTKNGGKSADDDVDDAQPATAFGAYELDIPSQLCLWKATPRPQHSSKYFCFTTFAMSLNQLMDGQAAILPPTDSRLRPDIRLMEEGNIDGAAEEKNRLEEKQRAARKERRKGKDEWCPRWFIEGTNQNTGTDDWIYTGQYFSRSWSSCPDIF